MKKYLVGGVAILAVAAAIPLVAGAAGGGDHGPRGKGGHAMHGAHGSHGMHHGGKRRGHQAKARMLDMLETYDLDADGSITQAEVDRFRSDRLAAFDTDGDGKLSLEEYEALWLDAMRARMVDAFQRHDDDGDGAVTVEEFGERTSRLVVLRDRNDDGVLNLDDVKRKRGHHGPRGGETPAGKTDE